jgi:hypothetical protein
MGSPSLWEGEPRNQVALPKRLYFPDFRDFLLHFNVPFCGTCVFSMPHEKEDGRISEALFGKKRLSFDKNL